MKVLSAIFLTCIFFTSCISTNPYKQSYQRLPEEAKMQFEETGQIVLAGSNIKITELTKAGIDKIKASGRPTILFVITPGFDNENFENFKSFEALNGMKGYDRKFVSVSHETMWMHNLEKRLQQTPDEAFVISNKDFGTAAWGKPAAFATYVLGRNVDKRREISTLFYMVINDTKNPAAPHRIYDSIRDLMALAR